MSKFKKEPKLILRDIRELGDDPAERKVFCSDCKHLKKVRNFGFDHQPFSGVVCECPKNLLLKFDWKEEYKVYSFEPNKINKYNNCTWYKPTLWKRIKNIFAWIFLF